MPRPVCPAALIALALCAFALPAAAQTAPDQQADPAPEVSGPRFFG